MARPYKAGLIGFGTIGAGVVKLLRAHAAEIKRRVGRPLTLAAIADIDIKTDRGVAPGSARLTTDAMAMIEDPEIDVVIELIGGYEPARTYLLQAIEHVTRAGLLVQAIDVLGDEPGELWPLRERAMCCVGREVAKARPAQHRTRPVPCAHRGLFHELAMLNRSALAHRRSRTAVVGDARLGADARSGEDADALAGQQRSQRV